MKPILLLSMLLIATIVHADDFQRPRIYTCLTSYFSSCSGSCADNISASYGFGMAFRRENAEILARQSCDAAMKQFMPGTATTCQYGNTECSLTARNSYWECRMAYHSSCSGGCSDHVSAAVGIGQAQSKEEATFQAFIGCQTNMRAQSPTTTQWCDSSSMLTCSRTFF